MLEIILAVSEICICVTVACVTVKECESAAAHRYRMFDATLSQSLETCRVSDTQTIALIESFFILACSFVLSTLWCREQRWLASRRWVNLLLNLRF